MSAEQLPLPLLTAGHPRPRFDPDRPCRVYAFRVLQRRPYMKHGLVAGPVGETAAEVWAPPGEPPEDPHAPIWSWHVYGTIDHPADLLPLYDRGGEGVGWVEACRLAQIRLYAIPRCRAEQEEGSV